MNIQISQKSFDFVLDSANLKKRPLFIIDIIKNWCIVIRNRTKIFLIIVLRLKKNIWIFKIKHIQNSLYIFWNILCNFSSYATIFYIDIWENIWDSFSELKLYNKLQKYFFFFHWRKVFSSFVNVVSFILKPF